MPRDWSESDISLLYEMHAQHGRDWLSVARAFEDKDNVHSRTPLEVCDQWRVLNPDLITLHESSPRSSRLALGHRNNMRLVPPDSENESFPTADSSKAQNALSENEPKNRHQEFGSFANGQVFPCELKGCTVRHGTKLNINHDNPNIRRDNPNIMGDMARACFCSDKDFEDWFQKHEVSGAPSAVIPQVHTFADLCHFPHVGPIRQNAIMEREKAGKRWKDLTTKDVEELDADWVYLFGTLASEPFIPTKV
jgi:hypothetical protein